MTIEQAAAHMKANWLDYMEIDGKLLGTFPDGIWVCQDNDSCNPDKWTKIQRVGDTWVEAE